MGPAAVLRTQHGVYSVLEANLPGQGSIPAGILLKDPDTDRLYLRLRRDWEDCAADEADVLEALEQDLAEKARELGAEALLEYCERNLSNTLAVTDRQTVLVDDFERTLNRLYSRHVSSAIHQFKTHLPVYNLRAAAGAFLDNSELEVGDWLEAPEGLRLSKDMFVARISGRSMEPRIPDGSLCVFRRGVVGSRVGRLVLVEFRGAGSNDRYTIKRYTSVKNLGSEDWRQTRIRLEPLNPEFEAWDLNAEDEQQLNVIAEFVCVLF